MLGIFRLKVDIVQMSVLEFKNRPGRPYYHLERFIVRSILGNDQVKS